MRSIKPFTFWPPFLLLIFATTYSIFFPERFLGLCTIANQWILDTFGWLFSFATFLFLLIILVVYFSPVGRWTIGGDGAKPLLSKWRWFAITLCTTIAVGILFWSTAEPLYHFYDPPDFAKENSVASILSILFTHWSFTPYGIYTIAGLSFTLLYYKYKQPFSLSSFLYPLTKRSHTGWVSSIIDSLCLFSLIAGMAASLGVGILVISGGISEYIDLPPAILKLLVAGSIGMLFILSALSGLLKGIRIFSNWNLVILVLFLFIFFIFGPTRFQLNEGFYALVEHVQTFVPRSVNTIINPDDWSKSWTTFNWANWMAWAPITALFLGKIAKGYTVRTFIQINFIYPSIFSIVWMMVFGGSALWIDQNNNGLLHKALVNDGPESVIYNMFDFMPSGQLLAAFFIIITILSYVTAADSNTSAISGLCTGDLTTENESRSSRLMKIIWGAMICTLAVVMISFAGIDGIKMASNLGGLPSLFLLLIAAAGMIKIVWENRKKEDKVKID